MLRVFKVTSPMSVGSWILAGSSSTTTTAAACDALGVAPRLRAVAEVGSGVLGAPLAVYTATLISDTAVPVWHEARRDLPFLFAAESAASAGAAATLVLQPRDARPARRLALLGLLASEVVASRMRSRLGLVGEVYEQGEAGRYEHVAKATGVGGAALLSFAARSRARAAAGGALVLVGVLARRFAVFKAGFQSARDPRYTVDPQRARVATGAGATRSAPA
jgi:formate-dependent nitrite reductase membrane component NrfD